MRSWVAIASILLVAVIPIGFGTAGAATDPGPRSSMILVLVLTNRSAENLPADMQRLVDQVRVQLGLTIDSAPSAGVSIYPRLSDQGDVIGYSATDQLTFQEADSRQDDAFLRAQQAAGQFPGADVLRTPFVVQGSASSNWNAQWLQFG